MPSRHLQSTPSRAPCLRGSRSIPAVAVLALASTALVLLLAPAVAMASAEEGAPALPDHACRLWGMIGTDPADSTLETQLVAGSRSLKRLGASNPDGWSVAYFSPALAAAGLSRAQILRGGPPADHDYDTRFDEAVAEMLALDPTCALAHVRAASSGHNNAPDPHPFRRGDWMLAHNGTLSSSVMQNLLLADDPQYLAQHPPDYDTPYIDSELFFLYLLKLQSEGIDRGDGRRRFAMADVISEAILRIYDAGGVRSAANCLMTAGDSLFAVRFDLNNESRYKLRYRKIPGAWVVASEPLGGDTTGWSWLPPKSAGAFYVGAATPQVTRIFPPPGPWLAVSQTKIDDDLFGQSSGNDDKEMDAGETVELSLTLRNDGGASATHVSAVLATADTLAQILDSTAVYAEILPGESGLPAQPFVVALRPVCEAYHTINFSLTIRCGTIPDQQTWVRTVTLPVRAPVLNHSGSLVMDGNDGMLQPGEEGDVQTWLLNSGGEAATSLSATLATDHPSVAVLQSEAQLDSLAAGQSDSLAPPFRIAVLPACPTPDLIPFSLSLAADWGITTEVAFELAVGGFSDPVEDGAGEWTHTSGMLGYSDAWHLSPLRNHTPGGAWSWKCGAADSGAVYGDLLDAMLVSPVVSLTEETELRFWHWLQCEIGGQFGQARDGALVEASINGGPWQIIYPITGYYYVIGSSPTTPGPFLPRTPVFAGYISWRQEVFEIHGYTGTIQFRFRFGTNGSVGLEGWYVDDVQVVGRQGVAGIRETTPLPLRPVLTVGGPSPFRESTAIIFDVTRPGRIDLAILDLEGRVVRRLESGFRDAGRHRLVWDGRDEHGRAAPSGLYFYRLRSMGDQFEGVERVIRLR